MPLHLNVFSLDYQQIREHVIALCFKVT